MLYPDHESFCVPVYVKQPSPVAVEVVSFEIPDITDKGPEAVERGVNDFINFVVYQPKKGGNEKYYGEFNELNVCNEEAISLRYCTEEQYGDLLVNNNDKVSVHLTETGVKEDLFTIKENGAYCFKSHSPTDVDYRLKITYDAGGKFTRNQELKLILNVFEIILFSVIGVIYFKRWGSNPKHWPFFILLNLILLVLKLSLPINVILRIIIASTREFKLFKLAEFQAFTLISIRNFYLFQYTSKEIDFKLGSILYKELEMKLIFIMIFVLEVISIILTSTSIQLPYYVSISGLVSHFSIIIFDQFVLPIWCGIRFFKKSKEYRDLNKHNDPLFKSFRIWILIKLVYDFTPALDFLLKGLKKMIVLSPLKNYFYIDGVIEDFFFAVQFITILIDCFMYFTPLFLGFLPQQKEL